MWVKWSEMSRCWNIVSIIKMKLPWLDFLRHQSDPMKNFLFVVVTSSTDRLNSDFLRWFFSSVLSSSSTLRTVCLYLYAFIYLFLSFDVHIYLYHCMEIFMFTVKQYWPKIFFECASLVSHERSVNLHSFFKYFSTGRTIFSARFSFFCVDGMQWRNEYCLFLFRISHTYLFNKNFYDKKIIARTFNGY